MTCQDNSRGGQLSGSPCLNPKSACRVCLRFSNLVKLYLNNKLLIQSTTGDYDAVLTCLDIPDLPQGFLPFSIEFASPPNAVVRATSVFCNQLLLGNKPTMAKSSF